MEYLNYKGYKGPISFSDEDNCYFGEVLGLQHATILFEGDTVEELKDDFEAGIDHYLDYCKECDVEPEKPVFGKLVARVPIDLRSSVARAAKANGESMNAFINRAVRRETERVL